MTIMMTKTTLRIFVFICVGLLAACSTPEEKAASYVESGHALLQEGKLEKAELEFKNALQVNQNQPDAWYGLAQIHERKQEWREAYATLNKIRELSPNHIEGRIMLGQLLLASNQLDQALKDASEILELAPDNAKAHALMAAVQFRLENLEGSLDSVGKSLAIDPANNEARLVQARVFIAQKKYSAAQALLDSAIQAQPDNISFYLMKIQAFQETNNAEAILGIYKQLIKQFPDNLTFRTALMRNHIARGDIDNAERIMSEIVQKAPENLQAKQQYIAFKTRNRSIEEGIALAKQLIGSNQDERQLQFTLADLYVANKQNNEAVSIFQSIIDADGLNPDGLEARNKLALLKLRSNEMDQARQLITEVLEHDKNNENALLILSGFQINEKNYDDAIGGLRTVLRDNPNSIKALGLLGQAYQATGATQLAQETFSKGFQLKPETPVIANQLASLLIRTRKYEQADETLLQSMSRGNNSLDSLKLLVQTKLALQDWDKAEQLAKQLKSMGGQEALSQQVMGVVLQGRQNIDASIEAFKQAHELAPTASQPVVALVQTYVKSGKSREARDFLKSVISADEDNITPIMLLGQLNVLENKPDEAKANFQKVVDIRPGYELAYRNLATVYARENNPKKAEEVVKQGLSATNNSQTLQLYLASTYERQRDFEKAIKVYEEILNVNPDGLIAKNNLASLLTDHKGDAKSLERARQIAADLRDSPVPQFRDTYAWASVRSDTNLEEAVVLLEGVVKEVIQGGGVFHYHLGEAYRKKGDTKNALASLKKAVEVSGPDSEVGSKANQSLQLLNQ